MYEEHGKLVDADASGAKASTKHLESRLDFRGHSKSRISGSLKNQRWTAHRV